MAVADRLRGMAVRMVAGRTAGMDMAAGREDRAIDSRTAKEDTGNVVRSDCKGRAADCHKVACHTETCSKMDTVQAVAGHRLGTAVEAGGGAGIRGLVAWGDGWAVGALVRGAHYSTPARWPVQARSS